MPPQGVTRSYANGLEESFTSTENPPVTSQSTLPPQRWQRIEEEIIDPFLYEV